MKEEKTGPEIRFIDPFKRESVKNLTPSEIIEQYKDFLSEEQIKILIDAGQSK